MKRLQAPKSVTDHVTPLSHKWHGYFLVIFIAVIPFIYSDKGVDPNLLPRQIGVCIFVIISSVVVFVHCIKSKIKPAIDSMFTLLFIALVIAYWFSLSNALNTTEAVYSALKITTYLSAFIVTYFLFQVRLITIQHVTAGFSLSLIATIGFVLRDIFFMNKLGIHLFESDNVYKINATFGHKNLLSAYLLFCIPFAILQYVFSKSSWQKVLTALLVIASLVLIVVLQTRAVLLALIISVLMVVIVSLLTGAYHKRNRIIPVSVLLATFLFASGLYLFRDKFSVIARTESFKERAALWSNSMDMLKEYPQGVGAANWQIFLPKYGIQKFYDFNYRVSEGLTTFQRPHNDFLWVACETGIVGGIIYLAMFLSLVFYLLSLIKNEADKNTRFIYQIMSGLVTAYVIVSLVDFPLERMEHTFLFALTAAFICSKISPERISIPVNKWWLLLPVAVSVAIISVCNKRWQSEIQLKKMYRFHAQGDWQQLISSASKAENEFMNMDYFSLPVSWYSGVAYFSAGDLLMAKKDFLEAYHINPYQVHVLNNLGVCYEKEKNYEKALPLLEQAHRISPTFSDGISTLAGAYYNKERYADAWKVISKFKYDDNNLQFKVFATAIIKANLDEMLPAEKDELRKKKIARLSDNDAVLMKAYKESQEAGKEYFTHLLNSDIY